MNSPNPLNIMKPSRQMLVAGYYAATWPYRAITMRRLRAAGRAPVMSVYYHRIANDNASPWTQSFDNFAQQMIWLKQRFDMVSLEEAQRRLREGNSRPAVHITFDDGYADNCEQAIPFLLAENIPCTYFVTTHFVRNGVPFPHDVKNGKSLAVNTIAQLREMAAAGIEIGGHTRTHANLGQITNRDQLRDEVVSAGEELQQLVGKPVRYFAFPYGMSCNLNPLAFHLAYEAGYEAVCSAYGGYNFPGDDAFHIHRIPVEDSITSMINRVTLDPRKLWSPYRYDYQSQPAAEGSPADCQQPSDRESETNIAAEAELPTSVDDSPLHNVATVAAVETAAETAADKTAEAAAPVHVTLRANTLVESVILLAIMAISQRMVGFVRGILFVRWLEPDELGQWDMSQGFLLLAAPLIVAGLPGCFGRYLEYYRQRGQLRSMLRRTATACAILTVIGIGTLLSLRPLCSYLMFGDWNRGNLAGLAAFTVLTVIAFNFINEMLTGLRMFRLVSRLQFANTVAFAVFSLGLLIFWRNSAIAVVSGYAAACVLSVFCMVVYLRQIWHQLPADTRPLGQRELWGKMLPFAGWMWASTLMVCLFDVADRYMVLHFSTCSSDEALAQIGYYHSSRVIPVLMVTVAYLLSSMITPHLSHDWEARAFDKVRERLNTIVKAYGLLAFVGCVTLLWLSPILFGKIFRGKYEGGAAIFPLTLTYCSWMSLGALLQTYLWCAEKARLSCLAMVLGVAANVAMNFYLLPLYGLHGAVLATVIANSLVISLIILIARRFGLKLERGAMLMLILPVTLAFGPMLATVALIGLIVEVFVYRRFFSAEQERMILTALDAKLSRFTKRIRLLRGPGAAQGGAS